MKCISGTLVQVYSDISTGALHQHLNDITNPRLANKLLNVYHDIDFCVYFAVNTEYNTILHAKRAVTGPLGNAQLLRQVHKNAVETKDQSEQINSQV